MPTSYTKRSGPGVYTPAYWTSSGFDSNTGNWSGITDGYFKITIDGTEYTVGPMNFSGILSIATVVSILQSTLRTATGGTETIVLSGGEITITSTDTTSSTQVTAPSIAPAGTSVDSLMGAPGTATAGVLQGGNRNTRSVVSTNHSPRTAIGFYLSLLQTVGGVQVQTPSGDDIYVNNNQDDFGGTPFGQRSAVSTPHTPRTKPGTLFSILQTVGGVDIQTPSGDDIYVLNNGDVSFDGTVWTKERNLNS